MKYVHVLIDYDNVRPAPERSQADVFDNLASLIPDVANTLYSLIPDSQEIWLRLYGGWIELNGKNSMQHGWLLTEVGRFRGRSASLRLRITIATSLICRSDLTLVGTFRNKAQKMVDVMLATDLIHLSAELDASLVIVSDDEDFVPSIIASSCVRSKHSPVFVLRRGRSVNTAPNDGLLDQCHIRVTNF